MRPFARMPRQWILDSGLRRFMWRGRDKSTHAAALMAYIAIVQRANNGVAVLSLEQLAHATYLSRQKVHDATELLHAVGLVAKQSGTGRSGSAYTLCDYDKTWQKLPALTVTEKGKALLFKDFHLRKKAELDALKLYLLLVAFRDDSDNSTKISYDKIEEYTGIERNSIKSAIDVLIHHNFIRLESLAPLNWDFGKMNVYRIRGVNSHLHRGTTGRSWT